MYILYVKYFVLSLHYISKVFVFGFVVLCVCSFLFCSFCIHLYVTYRLWLISHPIVAITNVRIHGIYICMKTYAFQWSSLYVKIIH